MTVLSRRAVVGGLAGLGVSVAAGACGPFPVPAQPGQVARIGVLGRSPANPRQAVFEARPEDLGWIKGDTLAIEFRDHGGHTELLPALAAELVRQPVDLILAPTAPEA